MVYGGNLQQVKDWIEREPNIPEFIKGEFRLLMREIELGRAEADPQVGMGATLMVGGDRYPYEIVQVVKPGREVILQHGEITVRVKRFIDGWYRVYQGRKDQYSRVFMGEAQEYRVRER